MQMTLGVLGLLLEYDGVNHNVTCDNSRASYSPFTLHGDIGSKRLEQRPKRTQAQIQMAQELHEMAGDAPPAEQPAEHPAEQLAEQPAEQAGPVQGVEGHPEGHPANLQEDAAAVPAGQQGWTDAQHARLLALVEQHGRHNWRAVAAQLPGRSARQCRERYMTHMAMVAQDNWSLGEEVRVAALHSQLGNR
ncbi:hypothetical protein OEZ86_010187 [Tetradesmus obliquus]|nr:hypothetical protein OEZ86_010187 [Tetradesmus obliquus]